MPRFLFAAWLCLLIAQPYGYGTGKLAEKPLTLTQVWKVDKTYTDQKYGVVLHYPATWQSMVQFGYHPPALTSSEDIKPIAGFGYSEGSFPRSQIVGPYSGTNLEGFGMVYSAIPAASMDECEAKAASISSTPKRGPVVLQGRSFSVYETGSAGMSQSMSGMLYVTYAGSHCYFFETGVAVASPGVLDNLQALTPAQVQEIHTRLFALVGSVRIRVANWK